MRKMQINKLLKDNNLGNCRYCNNGVRQNYIFVCNKNNFKEFSIIPNDKCLFNKCSNLKSIFRTF